MIGQEFLHERKDHLFSILKNGLSASRPHTVAFVLRVLSPLYIQELQKLGTLMNSFPGDFAPYGGYPDVAYLGFTLATHSKDAQLSTTFLEGLQRLKKRDIATMKPFFLDDVAILGIADGCSVLPQTVQEKLWLLEGIERIATPKQWSSRMRSLAADLLDNRGRLKIAINDEDIDVLALELVLRKTWVDHFNQTNYFSIEIQREMLKRLLSNPLPNPEDLERAAVWLTALDEIIDVATQALLPTVSDTVRILQSIEHSFKRWFWEDKPRVGVRIPAQWLIDNEYHVQAILWAILYPIYGSELVDETYLPNWGQTQPRADLGILKLKLIIEVKYLRDASDFQKIEGEIGNDLGLYFKDPDLFDRMIVFIYDDCDKHHPQKYDSLRNALIKRERIENIVIIRRPGMLPSRATRRSTKKQIPTKNNEA